MLGNFSTYKIKKKTPFGVTFQSHSPRLKFLGLEIHLINNCHLIKCQCIRDISHLLFSIHCLLDDLSSNM